MKKVCPCGRTYNSGRCSKCHPKKAKKVEYPSEWKALSESYRKHNPLCEDCLTQDLFTASEEVHHVIPISEDPSKILDVNNLVALCKDCHRIRHGGNSQR